MDLQETLQLLEYLDLNSTHHRFLTLRKPLMVETSLMGSSTSLHKYMETSPSKDKSN